MRLLFMLVCSGMLSHPAPASAALLSFLAEGDVTATISGPPLVADGTPLSVLYTVDDSLPDSDPADATHGDWLGNPVSASITVGDLSFEILGGEFLAVWTDDLLNTEFLHSSSYRFLIADSGSFTQLELFDSTGTAIANDSFPAGAPDVSAFDVATMLVGFPGDGQPHRIRASVDSIRAVPETAGAWLGLLGCVMLAAYCGRQGVRAF